MSNTSATIQMSAYRCYHVYITYVKYVHVYCISLVDTYVYGVNYHPAIRHCPNIIKQAQFCSDMFVVEIYTNTFYRILQIVHGGTLSQMQNQI